MKKQKAVVIGGGIHGITVALALFDSNCDVTIIERNKRLLQGTSGATHNRAHMGYHYPRSSQTAIECMKGLEYFKRKYPNALYYPKEAYYFIAKKGSNTSSENYLKFCDQMRLPYIKQWPAKGLVFQDNLDVSILVPEPCFDLTTLEQLVTNELMLKNIKIMTNSIVTKVERNSSETCEILTKNIGSQKKIKADIIINATYTHSNNILKISGLESDISEYNFHTTEVVVVRSKEIIIPALTVMDGKFISIMPYAGHKDLYLVYDVLYSVINNQRDLLYTMPKVVESNWQKMIEHGQNYFVFLSKLEFVRSLWGSRPVPVNDQFDSRNTQLMAHRKIPGFYSIREGKFISAPLVARELVNLLSKDGLIN